MTVFCDAEEFLKKIEEQRQIELAEAEYYKTLVKTLNLLKEEDFLEPLSPYGKTKLTIELILKDLHFNNLGKWRVANLRYFNPVGAHESLLLGEKPKVNFSNLGPTA